MRGHEHNFPGGSVMTDTLTIEQLLEAGLPESAAAPAPADSAAAWLSPLQDFVAGGGNHFDYQEDLVLSVNGLTR